MKAHAGFSGAVLVTRGGSIAFDGAHGLANRATGLANKNTTSFRIGSLSRLFTNAVAMRLVEKGRLNLDNTAGQFVSGGGDTSIRALLADPKGDAMLVRVVEVLAAAPYDEVLNTHFFADMFMQGSGVGPSSERRVALGYSADGKPAAADGSIFVTTRNLLRWLDAFFGQGMLSPASRDIVLAGWEKRGDGYAFAGSAPGFGAFVYRGPALTVIVLSNSEGEAAGLGDQLTEALLADRPE